MTFSKRHAALHRRQGHRVRLVGHVVLGVQDFEDALRRGRGLRHLRDDEAELAEREEDVHQVEAELLPFAEGQRAVDDLPAAEVEDGRLAQVGDQEDHREEEGEDARDLDLLLHQVFGEAVEARLLLRLAHEGLDDLDAGQVLLQDGVQRRELDLHLHEQRLGEPAEDHEDDKRHRQHRQDDQHQLEVGQHSRMQRADQHHERLGAPSAGPGR